MESIDYQNEKKQKSIRNLTFLTYILLFLGSVSMGIFSLLGVMLAYSRRKNLPRENIYATHLSYLIRTVGMYLIILVIGWILIRVRGIGYLIIILDILWYLWRLVNGYKKLSDDERI